MSRTRTFACALGVCTLALLSSAPVAVAGNQSKAEVLLDGLSSPKGLSANAQRELIVAQGAFGPPGPVLAYATRGRDRGTAFEVTDPFGLIDVAISPADDSGWALAPSGPNGEVHIFQSIQGQIFDVADITTYQLTDPDPVDRDMPPNPVESNPYGLAVADNGDALVADAAGNDLLRVTPQGEVTTVARFDVEEVATDLVPPDVFPFPLPDVIEAEAVPTTVTIGRDGAIYVGELKGIPFRPGSSNIWRIEPWADQAWCSTDEPDPTGACTLFATGFTAIQDIAADRHSGRMYVLELAAAGVFAFEAGFATGEFPNAVLLELKQGQTGASKRSELAAGALSQPGGVVVLQGQVYVTDEVFTGGRLLHVKN
jgi:hypothetical protein